jgi:acetolactate synthase small subunit
MWPRPPDMLALGLLEVARTGIAAIVRGPEGM